MTVPKYDEMYNLYLSAIKDGKEHSTKDIWKFIIDKLELTDDDLSETVPSGNNKLRSRISYTKNYLKNAGLIVQEERAKCKITEEGLKLLKEGRPITNKNLMKYESFRNFINGNKTNQDKTDSQIPSSDTPEDVLDGAYKLIETRLKEKLMKKLKDSSWEYFEKISVDILAAMGYGKNTEVTRGRKDGGVDGILYNDEFGFDTVYVQAKNWEGNVPGPVAKEFIGTLTTRGVNNGVIITRSKFTKEACAAVDAAKSQKKIILIDGEKLVELMIKYNVGVVVKSTQFIKDVDENYFDEDDN